MIFSTLYNTMLSSPARASGFTFQIIGLPSCLTLLFVPFFLTKQLKWFPYNRQGGLHFSREKVRLILHFFRKEKILESSSSLIHYTPFQKSDLCWLKCDHTKKNLFTHYCWVFPFVSFILPFFHQFQWLSTVLTN